MDGTIGPYGRLRKIDRDEVRRLVEAGHSTAEIAAHFACTSPSIIRILHEEGIPLPARRYAGRLVAAARPVEAPDRAAQPQHPPRLASLIATGGRYADLRAWAERWGVTETKARQEWFKLRRPVGKGLRT